MCKLLESRGWTLDHVSGAHYVYTHPDAPRPIPIPVHGNRDLRVGTHGPSCAKRASPMTISSQRADHPGNSIVARGYFAGRINGSWDLF